MSFGRTSSGDVAVRFLAGLVACLFVLPVLGTPLFYDVPTPGFNPQRPPTVSRARTVTLNVPALQNSRAIGSRLHLDWFPDQNHEAVVERIIDRGQNSYTLLGSISGQPHSSFTLVVSDNIAVINARVGLDLFQLRYLGNSLYDAQQIDQLKFRPCNHGEAPKAVAADLPDEGGDAALPSLESAGTAPVIDLMVVYTPAARVAAGGASSMQAIINLAIDEANVAYANSLINTRLRLVHATEVSYTESGSFSTDLNRLTSTTDGYLDSVHTLRNTYGADVVSLLTHDMSSCGYAWIMTSLTTGFASSAFSVVAWDCAAGNSSLAHEIGHNMGCSHDRNNPAASLYNYSYGSRFTGTNGITYRTVMAYAPGTRIQHFSNPNVSVFGTPTGIPSTQPDSADNAQTINNSAATVASFRQSVAGCTGTSVSPASTNLSANAQGLTLNISAPIDCSWTAVSGASFITIATPSSGTGPGSVLCNIASNTTFFARTGTVSVAGVTVTITQPRSPDAVTLAEALDTPSRSWTTGGNNPWFAQKTIAVNATGAAQSGTVARNQQSWLETSVRGPATLTFSWKVSSQTNSDFLTLALNGTVVRQISGEVNWQPSTLAIPDGTHTVRWTYAKDGKGDGGSDTAWLDQVALSGPSGSNSPPIAVTDELQRFGDNGTKILISALLANDVDPDGDPLTFVSVPTTSGANGAITVRDGWVYYDPPPGLTNSDRFTYTIRDARGAHATGDISVLALPATVSGNVITTILPGSYSIHLDGIPGKRYRLQYTRDPSSNEWQDLAVVTADPNGLLDYIDTTTETRSYRALCE